jgi:hypothetical protein
MATTRKSTPSRKRPEPEADFGARMLEKIRRSPAALTENDVFEIDANIRADRDGATRRMALLILAQPGAKLLEGVANERQLAAAVADTRRCLADYLGRLASLTDLLNSADAWMMMALCQREDMQEIIDEAGKGNSNIVAFPGGRA